jgi:hypothetical protein
MVSVPFVRVETTEWLSLCSPSEGKERVMRTVAVLTALAVLPVQSVCADKPGPPGTYKETSSDGRFVFVMVSPESLDTELGWYNERFAKKIKEIRTRYTKSGLYKNDGSNQPLWTVSWYCESVAVPSDGIHLVRFGDWPYYLHAREKVPDQEALKQEALSFYARKKLLKSYTIAELVDRPQELPRSVSHFRWLKSHRIIDRSQQFEAITEDGNRILFELATGKILKKERVKGKG